MNWTKHTLDKARSVHSAITDLLKFISSEGGDPDELVHLFEGHYAALDDLYLDRMPIAVALDESDLVLRYVGPQIGEGPSPFPRFTRFHRIFGDIHKEMVRVAKTHPNYACSDIDWRGDADLRITAADLRLIFGFKLPATYGSDSNRLRLGSSDPIFVAVKESIEILGVVAASLQDENPWEIIQAFAKGRPALDVAVVDAALHAVRRIIPHNERGIDCVEIGGLAVPHGRSLELGEDHWLRATVAIAGIEVPNEQVDVVGTLCPIDPGTLRFELRGIDGLRPIRCKYRKEHADFVKSHRRKKVQVSGRAEFDIKHNPRFVVVETITPKS